MAGTINNYREAQEKQTIGHVTQKIRQLEEADRHPMVQVSRNGTTWLSVTRYGYTTNFAISEAVAEELIAAGFSHGN